jgi:hypothetical protein
MPGHQELLFDDGLQQDQEEVESSGSQLHRYAVGQQLSPAQENDKAAEFEGHPICWPEAAG